MSASPNKKAISNHTVLVANSLKQLYEAKIFGMEKSIDSFSKQVKQISDAVNNEKSLIKIKYNEALDSVIENTKKLRKTVEMLQLE